MGFLSSGLLATVPSNNRNSNNEACFPVEASHDPSTPSSKQQEAPQLPRVLASAAVSDQEASCLAGYQMPVHTQGNWQSGVMMYMQDPQSSMGAHQQGESLTWDTQQTCFSVYLSPLRVCNSVNVPESQVTRAPVPGSCVTLRTHSRFPVHRVRKVRTPPPSSETEVLVLHSGAL